MKTRLSNITALWRKLFARAVYEPQYEEALLREFFNGISCGTFLDIGANTPDSAVSRIFLKQGWRGIAIEPIPRNVELLEQAGYRVIQAAVVDPQRAHSGAIDLYVAGGVAGRKSSVRQENIDPALTITETLTVPTVTLGDVVRENFEFLDLLAVDVEGEELAVMSGAPDTPKPRLMLLEDWALNTKLHSFLLSKGYKRIRRTGYNSWYVPTEDPRNASLIGQLHLYAKLNLFCVVRRYRRERKSQSHAR